MLTGNTKIKLSQIKGLIKFIVDAENLPPRKWSDGKMHEKVAGEWREVSEEKTQKPEGKSVNFKYTLKKYPGGTEYYEVSTNSDKAKYKQMQIKPDGHGNYYASTVKENKYGVKIATAIPEIQSGSLEGVKQQIENLVNETKETKQPVLTPKTKIKLSQIKPAESDQQNKTPATAKNLSEQEERIQKIKAEEEAYQEALKEKPTIIDGYESYQGIKVIDNKLRQNWNRFRDKATDDELDAIDTWGEPLSGDPYRDIQSFTRDPVHYKERTLSKEKVEKVVKNLDSAFKKAPPVGIDLLVVTGQNSHSMFYNSLGIKEKNKDRLANEIKKHVGETITNKSYLSTAVNEKGAEDWHNSLIEIRIKVPKDKKAIYLNARKVDNNRYSNDDGENELFINRGAKYKIDKVKVARNRYTKKAVLVEMTLMDDGVKK